MVTADADGNYVVVWRSQLQDGSGYGFFGQRFTAAGDPAGAEFLINTTADAEQYATSVKMDAAGNLIATWESKQQDGSGWGIYGSAVQCAWPSATGRNSA